MANRSEINKQYDLMFDEGLPFMGLTEDQLTTMYKEAEKAIAGKRGPVKASEFWGKNKDIDI